MDARGLPRPPYQSMGEIFKKEGLISSPVEERARMIYALSQELSHTISKIDGVLYAHVQVVLPEPGDFGTAGNASSAAVFIKYDDSVSLDAVVPQVRRLVANSIPGLTYENVSVILVPSALQAVPALGSGPATQLASVWGVQVAAGSAALLRGLLGGLAFCVLIACAGVGFLLLKTWREGGAHGATDA